VGRIVQNAEAHAQVRPRQWTAAIHVLYPYVRERTDTLTERAQHHSQITGEM